MTPVEFSKVINDHCQQHNFPLTNVQFFIVKDDSTYFVTNHGEVDEQASVLIGAMFSAAENLRETLSVNEDYFLDFSDGENGLLMCALEKRSFYVGVRFSSVLNKGKIKHILKLLSQKMMSSEFLNEQSERGSFLFKNITDEEVDSIFRVVRA